MTESLLMPIKNNIFEHSSAPFIKLSGLNPLVAAAMPLLLLLIKFKETETHTNIVELRQLVLKEISTFEANAQSYCTPQLILAARYCLCTALDEVVLLTPWGSSSEWAQGSLLSTIHQETWGGERCFHILEKMLENPEQNLPLLELIYLLLSLGFEGKYYSAEKSVREDVRQRLLHSISLYRKTPANTLSPSQYIIEKNPAAENKWLPLWKITHTCCCILFILAFFFNIATYFSARSTLEAVKELALSTPAFANSNQTAEEISIRHKSYFSAAKSIQ